MPNEIRIASVKKLAGEVLEKLQLQGIQLIDADFLEYEYKKRIAPTPNQYIVFTSKHGVRAYIKAGGDRNKKVFVINKATKEEAQKAGLTVIGEAENSIELAKEILKYEEIKSVTHYCGNIKRPELGQKLAANKVIVEEVEVYTKHLKNIKIADKLDGLMVYSPSGLDAFLKENKPENENPIFCIGSTTAAYAKQMGFNNIQVAGEATIDKMVETVIDYYKQA